MWNAFPHVAAGSASPFAWLASPQSGLQGHRHLTQGRSPGRIVESRLMLATARVCCAGPMLISLEVPTMEQGGWFAAAVAVFGVIISIGQFRLARSQRKLQEASSQVSQYTAWLSLATSWKWSILAANGPWYAKLSGLGRDDLNTFRKAIEEYRAAAVRYIDSYKESDDDPDGIERAGAQLAAAETKIGEYRSRAEDVLGFLGRSAGLVFRGDISISSAYNAFGSDLVAHRDVIHTLTAATGAASDHPGSFMPLFENFRTEPLEFVCRKIGWAIAFEDLPGFLQRIRALTVLMVARAELAGDLAIGQPREFPIADSHIRAALACTRTSSLPRSVRVVWNLRRAKAVHRSGRFISAKTFDGPFTGYWKARLYRTAMALLFPFVLLTDLKAREHVRDGLWDG